MKKTIYGLLLSVSLTAMTHGEAKDTYEPEQTAIKKLIDESEPIKDKKGIFKSSKKHEEKKTLSEEEFRAKLNALLEKDLKEIYANFNKALTSPQKGHKYLKKLYKALDDNDMEDFVKYYDKLSKIASISKQQISKTAVPSSTANVTPPPTNIQPNPAGSAVPPPPTNIPVLKDVKPAGSVVPPPPTNVPAPNKVKTIGSVVPPPPGNVPPPPAITAKAPASTKINVPAKKSAQPVETVQDQIAKGVKLKHVDKTTEPKKIEQPATSMNIAELAAAGRNRLKKTNSQKNIKAEEKQPVETEFQRRARERAERTATNH